MNICPNPEQCREEAERMFKFHATAWFYTEMTTPHSGQGVCHAIPTRIKGMPLVCGNKIIGGYRLGIRFNSSLRASNPPAKPVGLLARIRAALGFKS